MNSSRLASVSLLTLWLVLQAAGAASSSDTTKTATIPAQATPPPIGDDANKAVETGGGGGNVKGGADTGKIPSGRGTVEIDDFVAFIYAPGPRDPFISPLASGTIVVEDQSTEDISVESLMAFAEKLKDDLGRRIRVVGVSVPPDGTDPRALVIYAAGQAQGKTVVPALPPRTITVEGGVPVRYPPEETAFISRLAQLVAANSPIRLKRDSRTEAVIFPVEKIDDKGIQVMLPGYNEPILLPVYRELDTFSGAGD